MKYKKVLNDKKVNLTFYILYFAIFMWQKK
jgi:hypothetical protein